LKETKESKEKVSKEIEREKLFVRVIKRSLIKEVNIRIITRLLKALKGQLILIRALLSRLF